MVKNNTKNWVIWVLRERSISPFPLFYYYDQILYYIKKFSVNHLPKVEIYDKISNVIMKKRLKGGAKHMPNIKSAKKRVKVIEKKTLRNNMIKSAYKTAIKKFEQAIEAGNIEEAKTLFSEATKKIDQACTKGVIVKNTAARKKSSLSKKLNAAMA